MCDDEEAEDSWEDYDSGPFCEHWSDPSDCEEGCMSCGKLCREHDWDDDACEEFVNEVDQHE